MIDNCLSIIFISFFILLFNIYLQSDHRVVKAWGIEEEIFGGAPLAKFETSKSRKSIRLFMESFPNSKVKIIGVL